MKKLIGIIVLVVLLFSCTISCYAEQPSLRNGIWFGDTKEEVESKETSTPKKGAFLSAYEGKVGNYTALISYFYDKNNKLTDIIYNFMEFRKDNISEEALFNLLDETITAKYGDKLDIRKGETHVFVGKGIEQAVYEVKDTGNSQVEKYNEWLYMLDTGAMKIDLVKYYLGMFKIYRVMLSYSYVSPEQLQKIEDNINSLSNDL